MCVGIFADLWAMLVNSAMFATNGPSVIFRSLPDETSPGYVSVFTV